MADLLIRIDAGLTGLTARTLTIADESFSDAVPLTEISNSGVYRATIADTFDLVLVYDSAGTAIAQAESIATALSDYTVPTLAQVQAAGFTIDRDNALMVDFRRKRIDYAASTYTFYAADGTTPLVVMDLKDADGNAATTAQFAVDSVPQ